MTALNELAPVKAGATSTTLRAEDWWGRNMPHRRRLMLLPLYKLLEPMLCGFNVDLHEHRGPVGPVYFV